MAQTAPHANYPTALQDALAWLGAPPAADLLRDLAPMRKHLAAIADVAMPPVQYVKVMELFEARAKLASAAVKPLLLDATLPVPKRLRVIAQGLMQIHRAIASGFLRALREASPDKFRSRARPPARICAWGLAHLLQEFEIAQFISAAPAPDFWKQAEALYRMALTQLGAAAPEAAEAVARMKALLAMAAGQPEGFSPREVAFLAAYLEQHADAVEIPAAGEADGEYWVDGMHGIPPTASVRRRPGSEAALRYGCAAMGRIARAHLARLAAGERPEALGLPHDALSADYRDVLTRAATHWESPRVRRTNRRRHGSRVQVCTNLGRLWCQSGPDAALADIELAASEWMVLNESASGYAIMHVSGKLAGLMAGSAIGVRPEAGKPWSICIVRWARSDNPEHLELGLELVAPKAEAVRIVRPGAGGESEPLPALLLPPLAALKRGEALLTARGYFAAGPFALISEASGRIRVADCLASHLQMHTACIEIFEFERLRTPL
ncbi:MAG TPA: hypothetical protein VF816_12670 [Rhodocyclaceae bacterium]